MDEASDYRVVLARRYDDDWRPVDVVVFAKADGTRVIECEGTHYVNGYSVDGGVLDDLRLGALAPDPDAEHPLVAFKPWVYGYSCEQSVNVRFSTDGVWKAADTVDRVEVRVIEPDRRQPWRAASVHDGFVYWSGWSEGVLKRNDVLRFEWRAYGTDGNLIDAELLPFQSRQKRVDPGLLRWCQNL